MTWPDGRRYEGEIGDGAPHGEGVMTWPGYLRYVDVFALFHDSPAVLAEWRRRIGAYLARSRPTPPVASRGVQ